MSYSNLSSINTFTITFFNLIVELSSKLSRDTFMNQSSLSKLVKCAFRVPRETTTLDGISAWF